MALKSATSRNADFKGAKIRVKGGLWLESLKTSLSFSQKLHLYDPHGRSGSIQFIASRELVGTFTLAGEYPAENAKELSVLRNGTTLTGTELIVDNAVTYKGNVEFESITLSAATQAGTIPYSAKCRFTGEINADTEDGESIDSGDSGSPSFGKHAAGFSESATIGYQDDKQDQFTYPFIVTGVDETSQELWDVVETAINTLAATTKAVRGPSATAPFVQSGVGKWRGRGVVAGTFVYGRGPRDCSPNSASVSIGKTTQGHISEDIIDSGDSGDSGNFCSSEGISLQVRKHYKRPVPLIVYRVPGVWETDPATDTDLLDMIGFINNAVYSINGTNRGTKAVRFDGVTTQAFRSPAGTYWTGHLTFVEMYGGWKDNKLTCIRYQALPLEGNQTLPSYTLVGNSVWLYRYPSRAFTSIADLIPGCGY